MSDTHRISLRFNPEDELQQRAWEYLESLDREGFKSRREAVTLAVVDFFGRLERQKADPDWESREREERAVSRIVEAVEREIARTLPAYLAGCAAVFRAIPVENVPVASQEQAAQPEEPQISEADIDWDYLGQ